jgi:hypothetical protein
MKALLEGQYVVTFVGSTMGTIVCPTVKALESLLQDTYPNPGCPVRNHLMDTAMWDRAGDTDMPFHVFYVVNDAAEQYIVSIFHVRELST